jgi:hypothetical protein
MATWSVGLATGGFRHMLIMVESGAALKDVPRQNALGKVAAFSDNRLGHEAIRNPADAPGRLGRWVFPTCTLKPS